MKKLFADYLKGLKKTIHYGIILSIIFMVSWSILIYNLYGVIYAHDLSGSLMMTVALSLNWLWIYFFYFLIKRYIRYIEETMPENSVLRNSIRRFSEIREIDSGNWILIFILLCSFGYLGTTLEEFVILGLILGIGIGLGLRLIFLLYYFFGKFTNTRFNIITIILIAITLMALVNNNAL